MKYSLTDTNFSIIVASILKENYLYETEYYTKIEMYTSIRLSINRI